MITASHIFIIGLSLCLIILILELVRRKKLKEKYALFWLISGGAIFILSAFPYILNRITSILGIKLPSNLVFFFGILFIILINLHFSLVISNLSEQIKKLTQKLALLEFDLSNRKENNGK